LMTMYENYFLPLGKALLPGLPGLLLGLLPGIEEGSEYTDRFVLTVDTMNIYPVGDQFLADNSLHEFCLAG